MFTYIIRLADSKVPASLRGDTHELAATAGRIGTRVFEQFRGTVLDLDCATHDGMTWTVTTEHKIAEFISTLSDVESVIPKSGHFKRFYITLDLETGSGRMAWRGNYMMWLSEYLLNGHVKPKSISQLADGRIAITCTDIVAAYTRKVPHVVSVDASPK